MGKFNDLTGYENDYIRVICRTEDKIYSTGLRSVQWLCVCKYCGNEFCATSQNITKQKVKSCGCMTGKLKAKAHTTHGKCNTKLYRTWAHIISRCYNKNTRAYHNYGERGITVCEDWRNNFDSFYKWAIESGYSEELTIDRIDNEKGYFPDNCRWVDDTTQVRNRRVTVMVEIDGIIKPLAEWCEIYNANYYLVHQRIRRQKMNPKDALTLKPYEIWRKKNG
jgi:hypothetical protein